MKRIDLLTGARSELDCLIPLYQKLEASPKFEPSFIVSGMHHAPLFGKTIDQISDQTFSISARIDNLLASDEPSSRAKSAAILMSGLVDLISNRKPDFLAVVGDREESIVAGLVAAYTKVPLIHIAGGDHADDGNVDNAVRHATSKLAHLHMTMNQQSAKRLIDMGEEDWRVFVTGNPSLDRIITTPQMSADEVWAAIGANPNGRPVILVIQHPILSSLESAYKDMKAILSAANNLGLPTLVSAPNSDAGHAGVLHAIEEAKKTNSELVAFQNLPTPLFINLLRNINVLVGNSSTGLIEAPLLDLPAVNVGLRQRGRAHSTNIEFVDASERGIEEAVRRAIFDPSAKQNAINARSPYGEGNAAEKITEILSQGFSEQPLLHKRHIDTKHE